MQQPTRRTAGAAAATLTACSLFAAATLPAAAMTVTFVRHGESEGNASGYIDTKVPGPPLTATGRSEAQALGESLCGSGCDQYDGVYASTMVRTQQTSLPFAALWSRTATPSVSTDPYHPNFDDDVVVLNGLQEISAGIFEGSPEGSGIGRIGYILAPLAWTLGLRFVRIPGGEDGNEFDARVDAALAQMESEDGADANEVVFSHGATIMMWTMMNVDNPDVTLILTHSLGNTDTVEVTQNDDGSWHLVSWAGEDVADANYATQMFVNTRDLIVAPQTAMYNLRKPALALDAQGIGEGVVTGVRDVAQAGVTFVKDSVTDTIDAISSIPRSVSSTLNTTEAATLSASADSTEGADTEAADVTEAVKAAEKVPVEKVKANGATDLTNGNRAEPGKVRNASAKDRRAKVRDAVENATASVREQISSSVRKAGDGVRKAVTKAAHGTDSSSESKDAA